MPISTPSDLQAIRRPVEGPDKVKSQNENVGIDVIIQLATEWNCSQRQDCLLEIFLYNGM